MATITVNNYSQLLAATGSAVSGDTIFVPASVSIDLTGQATVTIPGGVTLASDRTVSGSTGGLLYTTDLYHGNLLQTGGDNVTISKIRIQGADQARNTTYTTLPYVRGVYCNKQNLLVEWCEIYGWEHAGVYVTGNGQAHIQRNYFHHNQTSGLGYGVSVNNGYALIEYNKFDYCRHAITGSGINPSGYEARYNLVLPNSNGQSFDMHGYGGDGAQYHAGNYVWIHSNTFLMSGYANVTIRGTCDDLQIYDNDFSQASSSTAFNIYSYTNSQIHDNRFGYSATALDPSDPGSGYTPPFTPDPVPYVPPPLIPQPPGQYRYGFKYYKKRKLQDFIRKSSGLF